MVNDVNNGSPQPLLKHLLRVSANRFTCKSFNGTVSFGPELRHVIVSVGYEGTLNMLAVFNLNGLNILVKHIVTQCARDPETANVAGSIMNKGKGFVCMGADYQRYRGLYSLSSANMKTFLLRIITHIP